MLGARDLFRELLVFNETRPRGLASSRVPLAARHALGLALLLALPGGAQNGSRGSFPQPMGPPGVGALDDMRNGDSAEDERRLRALNAVRQKSMVSDTVKLLKLAHELQDEVNRTNSESFTPNELQKVAEIEKLARSVKEKMSTSVRGTPVFQPPFRAPYQ